MTDLARTADQPIVSIKQVHKHGPPTTLFDNARDSRPQAFLSQFCELAGVDGTATNLTLPDASRCLL